MTARSKRILITGSSGLIGSEAVLYFDQRGHEIVGVDNNQRADFFGPPGDTIWNLKRLVDQTTRFTHRDIDIVDRAAVANLMRNFRPQAILHCAAQPSHDLAQHRVFDDFNVNAVGTLNVLEAARQYATDAPFVFMSTNKVYGDAPNEVPLVEHEQRYDYALAEHYQGIGETCRIDRCTHSVFGASKTAADVMTQEFGRYFGMPTVCFRGGCLTGPHHSGVELHGFLSHLVKVAVNDQTYTIIGYSGKQVRDQMHSEDVVTAMEAFIESPRLGEVYNLGGGRESNASILECLDRIQARLGRFVKTVYRDQQRKGDHVCYISDLSKFKSHYPHWRLTRRIDDIIDEMVTSEMARDQAEPRM